MMASKVFVSYTRADAQVYLECESAMRPLLAKEQIEIDGSPLLTECADALAGGGPVLLLVSHHIPYSELISIVNKAGRKPAWVLIKKCDWLLSHLNSYKRLGPTSKSIADLSPAERKAAWAEVAQELLAMVKEPGPASTTSGSGSRRSSLVAESSMCAAHVCDQPAAEDTLGFEPYVKAVAHFLTHPQTKAPLTLSVEGEWGSGKSSFMVQLEGLLRAGGARTVRFNAWRHDREEALWAAFAIEFMRQVAGPRWRLRSWIGGLKLFRLRFNWKDGFWDVIRWFALWLMTVSLVIVAIVSVFSRSDSWANLILSKASGSAEKPWYEGALQWVLVGGGTMTAVASATALWMKIKKVFGNPLDINLKKHVQAPNYENRVAFVEQFHNDFRKIVEAYAGEEKVFVFVDDVDRCEAPKASDLMQALNLLISDDPRLVFVIGMDREKVAAGIAVKHEKLLPYLCRAGDGEGGGSFDHGRALAFGYSFIEKFVQVPFAVPQPRKEDFDGFLDDIAAGGELEGRGRIEERGKLKEWVAQLGLPPRLRRLIPSPAPVVSERAEAATEAARQKTEKYTEALRLTFGGAESTNVREIAKTVAPFLEYNPRRLKQFVNVFRLQAYIGSTVGFFAGYGDRPRLVQLEQLGKFVALTLKYPLLRVHAEENRRLLADMQDLALDMNLQTPNQRAQEWLERPGVRDLLREGCVDKEGKPLPEEERRGCLKNLDIDKLLRVCSVVVPPQTPAGEAAGDEDTAEGAVQETGSGPDAEAEMAQKAPYQKGPVDTESTTFLSHEQDRVS